MGGAFFLKNFQVYSPFQRSLIFLLITAVYLLFGYGGLEVATLNPNSSPIWFCSGFAVGALLIFGTWLTPAIFLGSLLTNMLVDTPLVPLLCIAYGNTLEAILGAKLVDWILKKSNIKNYSELFAVILCALLPTIANAIIGVNALHMFGDKGITDLPYSMFTWWSGDAIGVMIVLPFFLELHISGLRRHFPDFIRIVGGLFLTATMLWLDWSVFYNGLNQAFSWIIGPFFLVMSFVMGPLYSRFLLIIIAIVTIYLTRQGFSAFEFGDLNLNLIYTQCILLNFSLGVLFYSSFKINLKNPRNFILGNVMAWGCLFVAIFVLSDIGRNHVSDQFERTVEEAMAAVSESESRLELLLEGGEVFVRLQPRLSGQDWREYVNSLRLGKKLEVINGLGLIFPFEKGRDPGVPVRTIDPQYASSFEDRLVIMHIEPMANNFKAIGLDIGSESNRRAAAIASRVSNKTVATGPILLAQRDYSQYGFLVLHPIKDKEHRFIGWDYMPVFYSNFFKSTFAPFARDLQINVRIENRSYFSNRMDGAKSLLNPHFKKERSVAIFGVPHMIEFYPSDVFLMNNNQSYQVLSLFLALFLYLLVSIILELMTFSLRSEQLVDMKARELDSSRMKLIYNSKMASLGEMASGMAHEINNPLSAILVKMEVLMVMMKEKGIENGEIISEIQKIKTIVGRISKIVNGLRTFSRSSESDPFEPVLLKQVLNETLDLCAEKIKGKGIVITVDEVPDVLIICRPGQISQVLLNLLNNSSDAIENNPDKWIRIAFEEVNERVKVKIIDSGRGIAPEIASRMMEPFFTTKDPNKGTGLGLSISKGIVEEHLGSLWLDTTNVNTCFVLELPVISPGELGEA